MMDTDRERHSHAWTPAMPSATPPYCMLRTGALFVQQPSFLLGAARVLDLGSRLNRHLYNYSETPEAADAWAIYRDWAAVADDLNGILHIEVLQPPSSDRR